MLILNVHPTYLNALILGDPPTWTYTVPAVAAVLAGVCTAIGFGVKRYLAGRDSKGARQRDRDQLARHMSAEMQSNWKCLDSAVGLKVPPGVDQLHDSSFVKYKDELVKTLSDGEWVVVSIAYRHIAEVKELLGDSDSVDDYTTALVKLELTLTATEDALRALELPVNLRWDDSLAASLAQADSAILEFERGRQALELDMAALKRDTQRLDAQITPNARALADFIRAQLNAGASVADVSRLLRERGVYGTDPRAARSIDEVILALAAVHRLKGSA